MELVAPRMWLGSDNATDNRGDSSGDISMDSSERSSSVSHMEHACVDGDHVVADRVQSNTSTPPPDTVGEYPLPFHVFLSCETNSISHDHLLVSKILRGDPRNANESRLHGKTKE
jgi:hypothetical protein